MCSTKAAKAGVEACDLLVLSAVALATRHIRLPMMLGLHRMLPLSTVVYEDQTFLYLPYGLPGLHAATWYPSSLPWSASEPRSFLSLRIAYVCREVEDGEGDGQRA